MSNSSPQEGTKASVLSGLLDNSSGTTHDGVDKKLDPDHYAVKSDKKYLMAPNHVFNSSVATNYVTQANWKPLVIKNSWNFSKKVKFDGTALTDLIGWFPFVAIGIYHIGGRNPMHGETSSHADKAHPDKISPQLKLTQSRYWKDI